MNNFENSKEKVKNFWKENKAKIVTIGAVIGGATAVVVAANKASKAVPVPELQSSNAESNEYDYGRDCLITYSVQDTGEVLWKELCTESYVEDNKAADMQYENIRKLNGLE